MRIKVDIDNCIRDCGTAMVKVYNKTFGTNMSCEDIIDYDMDIAFPKLKELGIGTFEFFFKEHLPETMIYAHSMKDSIQGLNLLKDMGHEIVIVSYQPSVSAKVKTINWLHKHFVPYDDIVFTNKPTKTIIDADVIIDDCMKYLDEASSSTRKVCIDWPYNRSKEYDVRVKSILEFAEMLINEAK